MKSRYRILFYLCDHMLATSVTLPAEMLRAAESAARAKRGLAPELEILFIADTLKPVTTQSGIDLQPNTDLSFTCAANDIIYLPAVWRNPLRTVQQHSETLAWLQRAYQHQARIAAVSTGVFFLAAAGLLNHKPATTHWHAFDLFQQHFPLVNLKKDFFITQSDNLYCAASINSLADLTVFFIREMYSNEIAHHVERHFSHEIRRPYESLRYFEGSYDQHSDESILQAQLWLRDHYGEQVKLQELAEYCGMSMRTFNRRFKKSTGLTPLKYLQETRMGVARELIQSTNLSIGEIAYRVGYADLGHFTALFKTLFDATPNEYRTTVRAKLFRMT